MFNIILGEKELQRNSFTTLEFSSGHRVDLTPETSMSNVGEVRTVKLKMNSM
jgi:hypothetical protein